MLPLWSQRNMSSWLTFRPVVVYYIMIMKISFQRLSQSWNFRETYQTLKPQSLTGCFLPLDDCSWSPNTQHWQACRIMNVKTNTPQHPPKKKKTDLAKYLFLQWTQTSRSRLSGQWEKHDFNHCPPSAKQDTVVCHRKTHKSWGWVLIVLKKRMASWSLEDNQMSEKKRSLVSMVLFLRVLWLLWKG